MKVIKHLKRLTNISYILFKYNLLFVKTLHKQPGIKIRQACEELGPIFVKIGQLLSTRADILPADIAAELAKLQDQVPPFCGFQARAIVESTFGTKITDLFASFDTTPLASASISQVHAATLLDGTAVVVKILRPNIYQQVARDIDIFVGLAKLAEKFWPGAKRFKPHAIALELKKSLFDELDLIREAANASQLKRNFTNSNLLYVPEVYWSHTRNNILTLERLHGIQVSNISALKQQNTNLKLLAERGVEIFFTQVFRDCFFHADMHPGNVWVSLENPNDPKYLALDFGIIGTLSPEDQNYLAGNFLAFFKRDYKRVAELHIESGWVPKHTRINEFESAIRCVCEPIFARPLKDISLGNTLLRLFETAKQFDIQIQPQLILLQKTLVSIEGLGRQLYPDLDLWSTAQPFLEDWIRKKITAKSLLDKFKNLFTPQTIIHNHTTVAAIRPSVWYYFTLGALSAALIGMMISHV